MTHFSNRNEILDRQTRPMRLDPFPPKARLTRFMVSLVTVLMVFTARPSGATWSIVAVDTETQEVVVASATCVANDDVKAWTPVVITGKGGGVAQALGDANGSRRLTIWNGLLAGRTAQEILDELFATQTSAMRFLQHGMAESIFGTSATQTGSSNNAFASGMTGTFDTVHYAIQGNILTGSPVLTLAESVFVSTSGDLPAKTMAAMEAARSMGGDGRCSCSPADPTGCGSPPPSFDKSAHNGFLIVSRYGDTDDLVCDAVGCADGDYFMDLNISFQGATDPDPVLQLQTLFDAARSDLLGRPDSIASTVSFTQVVDGAGDEWLLRVELNDWQGNPLGLGVPTFTVTHAPESDQTTSIGSIVDLGNGSYEVPLTETGEPGVDVFLVTADDGIRPVVLPPRRATLDLITLFTDGFESGDTSGWSGGAP